MNAPLLSPTTIAERLGVSVSTVTRLIRRKQLRAFKIGRQWRVRLEDVELMATPVDEPADEPAPERAVEVKQAPAAVVSPAAGEPLRFLRKRAWEQAR